MTRDEAFKEYEETLNLISYEFNRAKAEAKARLNANLKTIRAELHSELKAIRDLQQSKGRNKW